MHAFTFFGPLRRPVRALGWLITLAALAFMIQVGVAINARAHSVTDLLYGIFPFWGVTFLLWDWIARALSRGAAAG